MEQDELAYSSDCAATAMALEREGRRAEAAELYARAAATLARAEAREASTASPPAARLQEMRELREILSGRAERLQAELAWARRPRQHSTLLRPSGGAPAGGLTTAGVFVSDASHGSWPLVQCLMRAVSCACELDAVRNPDMDYTRTTTVAFEPNAFVPSLRFPFAFALRLHYPYVFQRLRQQFGLYVGASLAGSRGLFELSSPGKSGSCFFFTADMRFVIKTISAEELASAEAMAPHYYAHAQAVRSSLLCRVVGLYSLAIENHSAPPSTQEAMVRLAMGLATGQSASDMHIVVMENLVPSHRPVSEMYDLKGSKLGRTGGDSAIKKDLDIVRKLALGSRGSAELGVALAQDCQFLARHNVMDYSLLVAVCPEQADPHHCTCCGAARSDTKCARCDLRACQHCVTPLDPRLCHLCGGFDVCPIRGHAASPAATAPTATSLFRANDGAFVSVDARGVPVEAYYMGIIDWLQPFNLRKRAENKIKTIVHGAESDISVVEPRRYAARFYSFIATLVEPLPAPEMNFQ